MNYAKLLKGKRVFVTTGSQGIGKAIAMLFASHGAVLALGARNSVAIREAIRDVCEISPESKSYLFDLGDRKMLEDVCDQILADFGGIDILVNTVGVNIKKRPIHEYDEDILETMLETNYKSGLRCMKKFIPGMLDRGYGSIINISSIHSIQSMPTFGLYAGTKGAMEATTRAAALDYARKGIRINTVCPGLIMSDNMMNEVETYPEGEERDAFLKLLSSMQPLEPGSSLDVANAALFLASEMSAYTTGEVIMVDGGASIKAH